MLGDSVHALSPLLGMGASMAMEDAFVLAEELSKLKSIKLTNQNLENTFKDYFRRRYKRTHFLAKRSRQAHLLIKSKMFTPLRNLGVKLFYKIYLKEVDRFLSEKI